MMFNATGLDPFTDYVFMVAAINKKGSIGPYTPPVIIQTLKCELKQGKVIYLFIILVFCHGNLQ